jgi:hypothetical protein
VVGVPLMVAVVPLAVVKPNPAGSAPVLTFQEYGGKPLDPVNVWLYGVPTSPPGSVAGLIAGGAGRLIVMLKACVAVCAGLLESVTFTVKFAVPFGPVGVPVTAPAGLIANPGGKFPALVVNVKGASPPVAATVWLYAVPSTPAGSDVVVMLGGAGRLTVILSACVADCGDTVLASVTFTVKLAVPFGPVGVPLIVPEELSVSPAGREPELTEKVIVPAPPVMATAWL